MPTLDELLGDDVHSWQAEVDAHVRRFVEPGRRSRVKPGAWTALAVAACAAAVFGYVRIANSPGDSSTANGSGSSASCASPQLSVSPHVVAAGGTVTVRGEWFADGCNDTGARETTLPYASVPIVLIDGPPRQLAIAHPSGDRFSFVIKVRIPADAAPGPALIRSLLPAGGYGPFSHNRIRITG